MPSNDPFRVTRDVPGGINPGSYGRKAGLRGASTARMGRAHGLLGARVPRKCS